MADRLAATGVLLVGGSSERFGSPKALASFRGETLAERAWRTLTQTCDEVLAVGKDADDLSLPFAVLDAMFQGTNEHELDLVAAVRALAQYGDGDIVTVDDGETRVRVWVDDVNEPAL